MLTLFLTSMLTLTCNFTIAGLGQTESTWFSKAAGGSVKQTIDWWPMFRHDPIHTGYSTSTAPNTNDTIWMYPTGNVMVWWWKGSPVVADGKVFTGGGSWVYALNASTGAKLWHYVTGWCVESTPAVSDGKVYVGSMDSKVYALDATTGAQIWSYTTGYRIHSSPTVAYGKVYIGSGDRKVYALDAATGAYVWSYETNDFVVSSPAVANGMVYVGSMDCRVYALNATTGAYIWHYWTGASVYSSPAVLDGKVYVASPISLYALNATTGEEIWEAYLKGSEASPAVAYGKIYMSSGDAVYALNASTGEVIWNYSLLGTSSPSVADGKVYVGSSDGKIYALDAYTGEFLWSYATGDVVSTSPAVADGKVCVMSENGKVHAFGSHDVAIKEISVSKTIINQGYPVPIDVVVENQGHFTESFTVTVYANSTAIGTRNVNNLQPSTTSTLTLTWNTTDELLGNYFVSANASTILGEADTSDNAYDDGTVRIIEAPWTNWTRYHNYTEIVDTLDYLNAAYPNIADVFSIGKSWQNRDIYCIKLTNESNTHPKPKVFFVGYHHARELISAELPLYFAVEAATTYGTNDTITHMLNHSEIYIIPALNVDAFEVVKQNEWQRKNVHPYDEDSDSLLDEDPPDDADGDGYIEDLFFWNGTHYWFIRWEGNDYDGDSLYNEDWVGGVDLNRNYGYQWNATCYSGSPYPWAEDYRGPTPFSEPETQALRDLALSHYFKYAISFHSGTEVIGYPWGYTNDPTVDDVIFREIAANLSQLVGAPYGQNSGLYTMSGSWDDWMYANRSTFALTCEIYTNNSAWQYEPGPEPDTWWEKGVFQFFNPDPANIETVIQRWLPVFTYTTNRAITEAYDVAPTDITPFKTIVGQGFTMRINVTVTNEGDFTETFRVTIYANTIKIETTEVTLTSKSSITVMFRWNTTGFAYGNYTIKAIADAIPGETATQDNTLVNGWALVTIVGDVNGDFKCEGKDIAAISRAYNTWPGKPLWNPNADINDDDKVEGKDIAIASKYYGTHYP